MELGEVLADPQVEVISVCTPTPTHTAIAIESLRAGKNVLLEKPIALTISDALAIREVAHESGKLLMVAEVVRFFDAYKAIREQVDSGVIGLVRAVRASRLSSDPGPSSWWDDESQSGGIFVDFSIHDLDQLNLFLGTPHTVTTSRPLPDGPAEVAVRYEDGGLGQTLAFMGLAAGTPFTSDLTVLGNDGFASHRFVGSLETAAATEDFELVTPSGRAIRTLSASDPYRTQAEYFLYCLSRGVEPTFCPTDAAIAALAVSIAARQSLERGRPVSVDKY
jgi:predicted dehydrogenase